MKVKSNFMGNDTKINANVIALVENGKGTSLDKYLKEQAVEINQTVNGFAIKFANGFMIQQKNLFFQGYNFVPDYNLFGAEYDAGNWDIPFKNIISTSQSCESTLNRTMIASGVSANYSKTYAGKYHVHTVNGGYNDFYAYVTGYGYWK